MEAQFLFYKGTRGCRADEESKFKPLEVHAPCPAKAAIVTLGSEAMKTGGPG